MCTISPIHTQFVHYVWHFRPLHFHGLALGPCIGWLNWAAGYIAVVNLPKYRDPSFSLRNTCAIAKKSHEIFNFQFSYCLNNFSKKKTGKDKATRGFPSASKVSRNNCCVKYIFKVSPRSVKGQELFTLFSPTPGPGLHSRQLLNWGRLKEGCVGIHI